MTKRQRHSGMTGHANGHSASVLTDSHVLVAGRTGEGKTDTLRQFAQRATASSGALVDVLALHRAPFREMQDLPALQVHAGFTEIDAAIDEFYASVVRHMHAPADHPKSWRRVLVIDDVDILMRQLRSRHRDDKQTPNRAAQLRTCLAIGQRVGHNLVLGAYSVAEAALAFGGMDMVAAVAVIVQLGGHSPTATTYQNGRPPIMPHPRPAPPMLGNTSTDVDDSWQEVRRSA